MPKSPGFGPKGYLIGSKGTGITHAVLLPVTLSLFLCLHKKGAGRRPVYLVDSEKLTPYPLVSVR